MKHKALVFCAFSAALVALFAPSVAAADELSGPTLDTQGKPLSPPAPVQGMTARLWGISAQGGAVAVDLKPLNDRLTGAGYGNKLPSLFPLVGGQGFGLFKHYLVGGSGAAFLSRSVDLPGNAEASATGAWGTFDFGYQLVRVSGFLLVPMVSLGGYGMSVSLSPKSAGSFDDTVRNPARSTTLTNKGGLGGISVLAKLIVLGHQAGVGDARSGLSLGLRVGGLYGIPFRNWQADGASVSGGPSFGLRGGYAALSLGAGAW
jgi:hypothetical protein